MEEMKCSQIGLLTGGKWDKMHDCNRRVYSVDNLSPTLTTMGGGNTEVKIADMVDRDYRIRKLTDRECFRLMGVKEKDFDKVRQNQSMSSVYHLAGDSIVTTCLMAIFGEMLDTDYEEKIKELSEALKNENLQ